MVSIRRTPRRRRAPERAQQLPRLQANVHAADRLGEAKDLLAVQRVELPTQQHKQTQDAERVLRVPDGRLWPTATRKPTLSSECLKDVLASGE